MNDTIKALLESELGGGITLEKPKSNTLGHIAIPMFSFAKTLKQPPNVIAQNAAERLLGSKEVLEVFDRIQVVGGYINCFIKYEFLLKESLKILQNGFLPPKLLKKEKILLEYISANPTGPLHIGHARGAIFGDCLVRIGRFLGHEITSEYYVNDAGNQIYKLGLSIVSRTKEMIGLVSEDEYPIECYQGEYVYQLADKTIQKFGTEKILDEKNLYEIAKFGIETMLNEIKESLANMGIVFDSYISEASLLPKFEPINDKLLKNGGAIQKEGKLWLLSSQKGDEKDRVIVRENGEPTYLAGDIVYHDYKFQRNYDRYINIWGADHHGYIARVKAALEFLGYDSSKLEILLSQMVSLLKEGKPHKMSKRAGTFITMDEVVSEIGSSALRLIFLSKKLDTHLEFDIDMLMREDSSNPVFYIQYAHARIHTLFKKANFTPISLQQYDNYNTKEATQKEINLLVLALNLMQVIQDAFNQRALQKIVDFLKDLSAEFHRFYNEERIIGNPREKEILLMLSVVALSLKSGLELLGIEAKESMTRE